MTPSSPRGGFKPCICWYRNVKLGFSLMKLADNDLAGPSGGGLVFFKAARVPSVATPPVVSPRTSPRVRSG